MTARFTQTPAAHDGSNGFELHMEFSHEPENFSYRTVQEALFDIEGGRIERVWRRERGKGRQWGIVVAPDGGGAVTLAARATTDCAAQNAVCDAEGWKFAGDLSLTVPGPASSSLPVVSIAASATSVTEGAAAAFTLSRTGATDAALTVSVSVSVSGTPPTSVTFAAASASATLSVATEDDEVAEDASTVTATVSSGSGYTVSGTSGSADVVVEDDDAAPVVTTASPIVVAENATAVATLSATDADTAAEDLSWSIPAGADGGADRAKFALTEGGVLTFKAAKDFESPDDTARLKALSDWLKQETAENDRSKGWSRTLTGRELLMGSSFSLAAQTDGGGFAGLWGRMARTSFAGREGSLSLDGDVTTGLLGADYASGRWTTGLVVSHSLGEGGYRGATTGESSGEIEASVTAVTPWAGYAVTERLSVWGAAGYGAGELKLTPETGAALKTDLGMTLAAAGGRGRLIGGDGPKLDAVGDARWVRTTTASVSSASSDGGKLASASASATVTRLRLGLEGSWPLALGDEVLGKGAKVTPRLAIGLRHDGGDAETGFGADIGGGVTLAAPAQGLTVSLEGRGVLTHEAAGFRDRGVAGSLAWDPPPSNGRGPKLTLRQTVGAGASGGKDALLSRTTLEGLAANDNGAGRRRLEARFGYGFSAFGGGFTMSPEIGLGLSEAGRDYSLGWRLRRDGSGPGSLEFSLEARRRESANEDTPPAHGIGFRLTARF